MSDDSGEPPEPGEHVLRPLPRLSPDAHKGDAGRVTCVVGSESMPGAAILVARAAQRAGAGLVTVGCLDEALLHVVPAAAPEAVLLDLRAGCDAERLGARNPHALLAGPGLGDTARTRAVVEQVLAAVPGVPRALDADALNALAGEPERLRESAGALVLTPHPGEAARLVGAEVPSDEAGRVVFAMELAQRAGAVVCLKGRGTVVADSERACVNRTGNEGMATAGSGDVLAGCLVAYLAHVGRRPDWSVFDAAALAVHVHGLAGDLAAEELGRRALIASDLVAALPRAQRLLDEG